jgi:hypothetical protein
MGTTMTEDEARIAAAERSVERARERMIETAQSLARQVEPGRIARGLWADAKDKGADLAEEAVDAVKARPVAATGIVAGLALFLAREPIAELAGKWWNGARTKRKTGAPARKRAEPRNQLPTEKSA